MLDWDRKVSNLMELYWDIVMVISLKQDQVSKF
jgi:hypothetical protein